MECSLRDVRVRHLLVEGASFYNIMGSKSYIIRTFRRRGMDGGDYITVVLSHVRIDCKYHY